MATGASTKLYSPRLLALSTSLAEFPLDDNLVYWAEARSRTCGSTIALGLNVSNEGAVTRIGMQVTACAVGQSSAAILAQSIAGRTLGDLERAQIAIGQWLNGEARLPEWPGFDALEPAREHPGRHEALILPWNAAIKALSSVPASG